jgi:hypothetical protein
MFHQLGTRQSFKFIVIIKSMDEAAYKELVAKMESARKNADHKKHQLINREEFEAIKLTDEEIATALKISIKHDDRLVFDMLNLKADDSIRKQTLIPINTDVPKPKRRWQSYFITTKKDFVKEVPRTRYQKPEKSPPWVPILYTVLDEWRKQRDDYNPEGIIDTLDLAADEHALPSLMGVINDYPEWPDYDGYGNAAVKAIWAVKRIGNKEAMDELKKASTNPQILKAKWNEDVMRAFKEVLG